MTITLNGTTGVTTPDIDSTAGFDGEDLTGDIAAARITDALNATGSAPLYACRAWVNFNGTGTVAIRASGNVSSVTDNGTGNYTINFSTDMEDSNYSAPFAAGDDTWSDMIAGVGDYTASSVKVTTRNGANVNANAQYVSLTVVGN